MPRTAEIDYIPIKKYYILHPNVTNKSIALKFKVSYDALRMQIHSHKWKQERDEYYGDMEADFRESAKARDLIERDELDARLKKNNSLLMDQVEAHLSAMGVGVDEDGLPTMIRDGLPIKDLRALADIQKTVHESEYRRLNVALPKQPIEVAPATPSPGELIPLSEIDLEIEAKVKTVQYVDMPELPVPGGNGGNGNGNKR